MDTVRVFRILEYVGPREAVEWIVSKSIQGERVFPQPSGDITVKAATLGTYPEILKEDNSDA